LLAIDQWFKLASIPGNGGAYAMTTHEESARMRQEFLRAALEAAQERGGPTSLVYLARVAEKLGADLGGEAAPLLMRRYAEMASYYRETGDVIDLSVPEGSFRLTARGVAAARGEG
jgi:hypothetical protein